MSASVQPVHVLMFLFRGAGAETVADCGAGEARGDGEGVPRKLGSLARRAWALGRAGAMVIS